MAAEFNPYHKWLGIPPEEQPANHYRLLGIKVFEADPDVIESAADQRMAHLRTLQSGKNAELSQKLLNEISAAKGVLLQGEKRAAYDQQLRQTIAAAAQAKVVKVPKAVPLAPRPTPAAFDPLQSALPAAPAPLQLNTRTQRKRSGTPLVLVALVGGGIVLLVVVGLLAALNSGGGDTNPPLARNAPDSTPIQESVSPSKPVSPIPPEPPEAQTPPPIPKPDVVATDAAPAPDRLSPASPAPVPMPTVEPVVAPTSERTVVKSLGPIEPAYGKPIDLLARIDTKRDAVSGPWVFEEMALHRRGSADAGVLQIPLPPPAEYDLQLIVERHGGGMGLGVVAGGKRFPLAFDADTESFTGLMLDGEWSWKSNDPTVFRGVVAPRGTKVTIVVNVRKARLRVQVNDELILDWQADYGRCTPYPPWETKDQDHLYLASNQSRFYVHKFELIPLGAGESIVAAPGSEPETPVSQRPAPPDEARQAEIRKSLNELYKLTARRTPAEKRQLAGELTTLADGAHDKPAERYVFLREAQRLAGEAGDFDLALRAVEAQGEFEVDTLLESGRVLITLAAAAKDDAMFGKLVDLVPQWVERAMAAERTDEAEKLLEVTARALAKPAGRKFAKPIIELRAALAERVKQTRKLQAAREKLKAEPADAEANLVLGSWLCFERQDWPAGLPLLAKSGNPELKACAEKELAGAPKTAEAQIELADLWWDCAQQTLADERVGPLSRAASWYRLASAQSLVGLTKVKVDQRLEDMAPIISTSNAADSKLPPPKGSRVLLVMGLKDELSAAESACQKYGLAFEVAKSFDRNRVDYSAYHTILCGSNDMKYWGKEEASKDPAAFQNVERFVNQGGHFIVCGTFNGVDLEHLQRFGIYTGFQHSSKFERTGPASDLLFAGAEDLVPADGRMTSAGHFNCYQQHIVLLKRGAGAFAGAPALLTKQHQKGRLTFTQCEPHWRGDMWLIPVLLNWVSRGSPVP